MSIKDFLSRKIPIQPLNTNNPDVEAEITNLRVSENAFHSGYRACHLIKYKYLTTGVQIYVENDTIKVNETHMGTVTFISPKAYPATLWIGRTVEMYEGNCHVGNIKIIKIFNELLDRDKAYPSGSTIDVTKKEKLLNIALCESLTWGKDFIVPLDVKIMRKCNISGQEIEALSKYVLEIRDEVLWKIYYDNYDRQIKKLTIDGKTATLEKYPWINNANILSLDSQGMYYAWHG